MKNNQPLVEFAGYSCSMEFGYYDKDKRALSIQLVSAQSVPEKDLMMGEPIARATVNHPVITPAPHTVIIKNYSENVGMAEALVKAGLVEDGVGKIFTTEFGAQILMMNKTSLLMDLENAYRRDNGIPELKTGVSFKLSEPTELPEIKRPKP